jgi:hypothetical protein
MHNRLSLIEAPPDDLVMPELGSGHNIGDPAPFKPDVQAGPGGRMDATLYERIVYKRAIPTSCTQNEGGDSR